MIVMTWNILVGGGNRLDAIRSVIMDVRPDVLALQELRGWDQARLDTFATSVGMTGHLSPSLFGQPVALLFGAAFTGRRSVRVRLHHAAAAARFQGITFVSTHLNAVSPYRRLREARWLAARFGSRRRPVVIAGDLNSLHPGADHTASLAGLPPRYLLRHVDGTGGPDLRAMTAFADGGFRALPSAGHTAPTLLPGADEFCDMRLDYVLANRHLTGSARVIRGGVADHASDHYPVVAEIQRFVHT